MGEGHGGQYITLYEADKMMSEIAARLLGEYEERIVNPRHEETQASLATLMRMFWAIILLLLTVLGTVVGTLATRH